MIVILLISLVAIFKSIADTLDDHFTTSIFRKLPWQVWDANRATTKKFLFTNYKLDPWHLCNSMMILCFFAAMPLYKPFAWLSFLNGAWQHIASICVLGIWYNFLFELFYAKFLIAKPWRKK